MMNFGLKSRFEATVTIITNEFIDKYMAAANGEYVKVYLYLLRHDGEPAAVSEIADALNHTESDVRRALSYWERVGVLVRDETGRTGNSDRREQSTGMEDRGRTDALAGSGNAGEREELSRSGDTAWPDHAGRSGNAGRTERTGTDVKTAAGGRFEAASGIKAAEAEKAGNSSSGASRSVSAAGSDTKSERGPASDRIHSSVQIPPPPADTAERMQKLSKDEEFATLLYAAQQYLGKMFTTIECEKFAYFYDILKMSGELLEYLAEYCAQNGHTSIRYVEKVALNWYQQGIRTKAEAKEYTSRFSKDISSVMKAFGLTNRSPGTAEKEIIKKWFHTYGFDQSLVTEACNRTIKATQTPSFQYADKILAGWKENGVRTLADVEELDRKRQLAKGQSKEREPVRKNSSSNRFRNFEERNYNYDEAIWDDIRKRYKKGGSGDGTE